MGGITHLLLLLLAGVTVSTVVDLHKNIIRIIGGQECGNNERHYHVKLVLTGGYVCGGSLLSERWILTAKHCKANTITAHLGLHPRTGKKIPPIKITDPPVIFSEKYDIMMLKLPKAAQIQPIALPEDCVNRPKIGDMVQIAGYGPTATHPILSPTLQCGNTKVIKCELVIPDKEFCGDIETVRQMPADSGGGVVFKNRIYGVISDEISFVDVCDFIDWIKDTMNRPLKCRLLEKVVSFNRHFTFIKKLVEFLDICN